MRVSIALIILILSMAPSLQAMSTSEIKTLAARVEEPMETPTIKTFKGKTVFETPGILTTGTLFYVAISVSTFLWCTGKGIDMTLDHQERLAITKAYSASPLQ